jgi:predicted 3-demethylubiquinone-9 3-methyltransferase (glyoxalase superfamily)
VSLFVSCKDQAEVDRLWKALTADGGAESMCGWLKDRFGVSWQIIPAEMMTMFADKDQAKAGRAMQAMLTMRKIDLAALRKAFAG